MVLHGLAVQGAARPQRFALEPLPHQLKSRVQEGGQVPRDEWLWALES